MDTQAKDLKNGMKSFADKASDTMRDTERSVPQKMQKGMENFENTYDELADRASEYTDASITWVKKNPVYAVLGAVAVGYVVSSVFRRS